MVTRTQGGGDEGDNVTREIWEDPGKIRRSMHLGKRNEVEKRKTRERTGRVYQRGLEESLGEFGVQECQRMKGMRG